MGIRDIRTFEFPACKHVNQTVVELIGDPMKLVTTNAWLRGHLQRAEEPLVGGPFLPDGLRGSTELHCSGVSSLR